MLLWSSQNKLSQSKIVKSSAIWFFIVPLFAKIFEHSNKTIVIKMSGFEHVIELDFPFKWQFLFFAALFFMLANLTYQLKAKHIVKNYSSFSDFEIEGNGRLQIHQNFKDVAWQDRQGRVHPKHVNNVRAFLENYCSISSEQFDRHENYNVLFLEELDKLSSVKGKDSDAFYFVYNVANSCNKNWIIISLFLYGLGFIFLLAIAMMNIIFVIKTML